MGLEQLKSLKFYENERKYLELFEKRKRFYEICLSEKQKMFS